jgi:hypothetical protein
VPPEEQFFIEYRGNFISHISSQSLNLSALELFTLVSYSCQPARHEGQPASPVNQPASQPGLRTNQPGLRVSEPGLKVSQLDRRASQPGLRASQPGLRASQPGLRANQPATVSWGRPARCMDGWKSYENWVNKWFVLILKIQISSHNFWTSWTRKLCNLPDYWKLNTDSESLQAYENLSRKRVSQKNCISSP